MAYDLATEAQQMKDLATHLASTLANEVILHGEDSVLEETLDVLSVARDKLNLQAEFEGLDSLNMFASNIPKKEKESGTRFSNE